MYLSIIMPCKNEKDTIVSCIESAKKFLSEYNVGGEILVIDGGSTDGSRRLAKKHGAKVISQTKEGYGTAIKEGINRSNGDYIIVGDCDGTYDFSTLNGFVQCFKNNYDYVNGDRLVHGIEFNLSFFVAKFLSKINKHKKIASVDISDISSGLFGFSRDLINKVQINSEDKNFVPELIHKANEVDAKLCEVPVCLNSVQVKHSNKNVLRSCYNTVKYLLLV